MFKCDLNEELRLLDCILSLDYFITNINCDIDFLTVFILTVANQKPDSPEKKFRQSVDSFHT